MRPARAIVPMAPLIDPRLEALLAQANDLPTLPVVALEVLRLCRAEDTTLDDLARALSSDPALTARLLRFANSSLYGCGEEVRSVQRATLVLGMKTVQLMALSFSLVSAVPREGKAGSFDYGGYWRRSLVRAVSARALAGRVGLPAQDEAFLSGLLAEIGQVVLARCLGGLYEPVLSEGARRGAGWPRAELEREQLGFDHMDVGGALLRSWQLPQVLQLAVANARDAGRLPNDTPPAAVQLIRVLALAGEVTDLITLPGGASALGRAQEQAHAWFGLDRTELGQLLMGLEAPIRETAGLLELTLPQGRSHEAILEEAHDELVQRSLIQARELTSLRSAVDPTHRARLLAGPAGFDSLSGCANQSAFDRVLAHELRARLDGNLSRPLGLLLIAIDGFAALPDEEARAEAQRALGGCVTQLSRKQDLAVHLAPGLFGMLLGDANPFGLRALAARVLQDLERLRLRVDRGELLLGVSIGGACLGTVRQLGDGEALRHVAERLLDKARSRGRNAVEVHGALLESH